MNERFQELALQAGYTPLEPRTFADDLQEVFLQKFAQLIVRECVDICDRMYVARYPDAEDFERSEEGDAIKQHFGVE